MNAAVEEQVTAALARQAFADAAELTLRGYGREIYGFLYRATGDDDRAGNAGEPQKALGALKTAARLAIDRGAIAEADARFERALTFGGGPALRIERVLRVLNGHDGHRALAEATTALAEAEATGDAIWIARALAVVGRIEASLGAQAAARRHLDAARAAQVAEDVEGCAWYQLAEACLALLQGQLDLSEAHLDAARTLLAAVPTGVPHATLTNYAAVVAEYRGDTAGALGYFQQAERAYARASDGWSALFMRGNQATILHQMGALRRALAMIDALLPVFEDAGHKNRLASFITYRAAIRRQLGDADATDLTALERAEAIQRAIPEPLDVIVCLCERGHFALAAGLSAAHLLAEAVALGARHGIDDDTPSEQGDCLRRLAAAQDAFEFGEPLIGGEAPDAMWPALRRRLDTGDTTT